jgi:hypothetical protein
MQPIQALIVHGGAVRQRREVQTQESCRLLCHLALKPGGAIAATDAL